MAKKSRAQLGLTQGELAARLGCTDSYCTHLEREFRLPSENLISKMAERRLGNEGYAAFQEAVVEECAQRYVQRIRTRGAALRAPTRGRGGVRDRAPDATQIARELEAPSWQLPTGSSRPPVDITTGHGR